MNIAIVGAGAIGCRIAAHLAQRGTPFVLFDGWAEHVRALQQEGLRLRRAGVESRFPVRACMFDAPPPDARFDAVLLCVRSDATAAAMPLVQHLLAPHGFVVSCQNGLNEEEIAAAIGAERTLGCSMIFGARLTAPGMVTVLEGADTLRLGELSGKTTPRLQALADVLSACGTVSTTSRLLGYRWMKLVLNATGNPLLLISGLTGEQLHAREEARRLIIALTAEILRVARQEGVEPEPVLDAPASAWLDARALTHPELHARLVRHGQSLGARRLSMAADFEARGRTEIHQITGKVVAKAQDAGLPVPLNAAVLHAVQALEARAQHPAIERLEVLEAMAASMPGLA